MKALMGQLGKQLYSNLLPHQQKRLLSCLNDIGDKSDLIEGAKCLTTARNLASKKASKFTHTTSMNDSKKSSPIAMKALHGNIAQNSFILKHDGTKCTNPPFLSNFSVSFSPPAQTRSQMPTYKSRPSSINSTADRFLKLNNSSYRTSVVSTEMSQHYNSDSSKLRETVERLSLEAIIMPQKPLFAEEVHRKTSFPSPVWSSNVDSIPASHETFRLKKYSKTIHLGADNKRRSDDIFQILKENIVNRRMAFKMPITFINNKRGWREKRFNQRWRKSLNPMRYLRTYSMKCIGRMSYNQRMNEPYDIKRIKRRRFTMKRKNGRFEFFSSKNPLKRRKRNSYAFVDDEADGHLMRNFQIKKMERISKLIDPTPKSLAQRVTHLIRSAIHGNETLKEGEWSEAYKRLLRFKKALEEKKKLPGARVYERRLYDIVVDSKYPTISPKRKV
uniref:Uncharacterized protein n=1 Tax=Ascaris lumbricoides TaxID=6252 RepID=A0A0M3I7M4_ASCLU